MQCDIWIKNGHVIDPASGINSDGDVLIQNEKIIKFPEGEVVHAEQIIDAKGCLVFPGLIDSHVHVYEGGTEIGVPADVAFLPVGVTTVVDAGSAGTMNYQLFSSYIIPKNIVRIKTLLNLSPTGLVGVTRYHENVDPQYFDIDKITFFFEKYRNEIIGLKLRISQDIVENYGIEPLKAATEIAQKVDCPLVVHTTNPPVEPDVITDLLRSGDVYCHVHSGTGHSVIGTDGCVLPKIKQAQKQGILFDVANGNSHFAFKTAQAALRDNFLPDIISTDLFAKKLYSVPIMGLPYVMSKYINMGMDLYSVVAACTVTPARFLGMDGLIGTLRPGAYADVAIFKLIDSQVEFRDALGEKIKGRSLLLPQATIRNGRVVYRQINF